MGEGETKILKRGMGKLSQEVGPLKRGDWNPLTNYVTKKAEYILYVLNYSENCFTNNFNML